MFLPFWHITLVLDIFSKKILIFDFFFLEANSTMCQKCILFRVLAHSALLAPADAAAALGGLKAE